MSGKAKTVVILLVLSWLAVGVVVSYLATYVEMTVFQPKGVEQ